MGPTEGPQNNLSQCMQARARRCSRARVPADTCRVAAGRRRPFSWSASCWGSSARWSTPTGPPGGLFASADICNTSPVSCTQLTVPAAGRLNCCLGWCRVVQAQEAIAEAHAEPETPTGMAIIRQVCSAMVAIVR